MNLANTPRNRVKSANFGTPGGLGLPNTVWPSLYLFITTRKVHGSKRKGRRASQLRAARTLVKAHERGLL